MSKLAQKFRLLNQPIIWWLFSIAWLGVVCGLAFLWNLGNTGLVDETEPLFAEAARQMTVTGNWITPYFNEATRFDKPPLIYWLMALGYQFLGVNPWAVRLPSALAAILLTLGCFFTLRRFSGSLAAWIGAALVAFNPQTLVWARTGVSDMLLSCCLGSALLCFFWGYSQEGKGQRWYFACYLFLGLAVLTKGPVGIVLPGMIIFTFLLYVGKLRQVMGEMRLLQGSLIFLIVTVPWYALVTWQNGAAFIDSFFGYHNLERFTSVVNRHSAPWYFYFLVVLLGFLPWSAYLPVALLKLEFWRVSHWRRQPRVQQLGIFAFFWLVSIFLFFTIAVTKLPSYVLPLIPAAAILVALLFSDAQSTQRRSFFWSGVVNFLLLMVLAIAFIYSPEFIGKDRSAPNLAELLVQSGIPIWGFLTWLTTALIVALFLSAKKYWRWLWSVNFLGFIAFILFVFSPVTFLVDSARQLPLREISATITQLRQPEEEVLMVGFGKPSVVFYTQQPVEFFTRRGQVAAYIKETLATPRASSSVLLLLEPKYIDRLKLEANEYQILSQKLAYLLVRVEREILRKK